MRDISFRIYAMRRGAIYKALRASAVPRIDANARADIKCSAALTVEHDPDIKYFSDAVKIMLVENGEEKSLGVFYTADKQERVRESGKREDVLSLYDGCYLLYNTVLERRLYYPAGKKYTAAVKELLTLGGIALQNVEPSELAMTTDREYEIGTRALDVINELLGEINYGGIWFDADGYAVAKPALAPSAANIKHRFGGAGVRMARAGTRRTDAFQKANVFTLICENPEIGAPLVATAENSNPLSPFSTISRGRRIADIRFVNGAPSLSELQARASRLALDSTLTSEMESVETEIRAGHGIGDIVAVDDPVLGGIYRETAWSIAPGAGESMTHTLERLILI